MRLAAFLALILCAGTARAETAWLNNDTRDVAWTAPGEVELFGQPVWRPLPETLLAAGYAPVEYDPGVPLSNRIVTWDPPAVRPMTEAELSARQAAAVEAAAAAETARILAKPDNLKRAENEFLSAVGAFNYAWGSGAMETNAITAYDGFTQIYSKIDATALTDVEKLRLGMRLQALWDVVLFWGGRFGDVQWHAEVAE